MEAKEETSDTDSGIILHSGPDSPCTVMKDVTTHTRVMRLKLQSLEEHLEACVSELKKLCIREAELTGQMSSDYPLLPGEKPPQVRRRIGAAFMLDEQSFLRKTEEDSDLGAVERELALQQQIVVAARRLCQQGAPSKAVRRSRQHQCDHEENKLKRLQEAVFHLRLQHGRASPHPAIAGQREERASQATQPSLEPPRSDHGQPSTPPPHLLQEQRGRHTPPQTLGPLTHPLSPSLSHTHNYPPSRMQSPSLSHPHNYPPSRMQSPSLSHPHNYPPSPMQSPSLSHPPSPSFSHPCIIQTPSPSPSLNHTPSPSPSPSLPPSLRGSCGLGEDERPPIQHSPWSESSLDQPYEKPKKTRTSSCRSGSPAVTPTLPPLQMCVGEGGQPHPLPSHVTQRHSQSNSAPCTPEMQLRRGLSLRLPSSEAAHDVDLERGRSRFPRRRLIDMGMSPESSPLHVGMGNPLYYSSSEDSMSEHSATSYTSSYTSSSCHEGPAEAPHPHPCQLVYGYPDPHPHNGFYRNIQHQSTPSFSRAGYPPHMRAYPPEAEFGQTHASPCPGGRYDYWYEEAPVVVLQRVPTAVPAHVRLARAPSLREYPQHHPASGLPRQLVSEELKSWHQRHQFHRPRSLDRHRQGAVRVRTNSSRESPLSQQPLRLDQPPQTGLVPRMAERNYGPRPAEDDLIISQV
ncbi:innate immunity activator b isoform X2 [Clupea harengus]|uniref:Innate immunity activator b isoform X2 n=1 Tax=Clupea harengus TaxID=7950 RepID=A0A6P8FDZ5_CLUHA|nr:innate immunity activator b isoform X2 [Clupea harengus]